jgi:purine nucleosidase
MNVIIDTDPGIDDFLAIVYACKLHQTQRINLVGLTITHGNSYDTDKLAKNACFALELCGVNVPVVVGAPTFLEQPMKPPVVNPDIHGHENVLGNYPIPDVNMTPLDNQWNTSSSKENAAVQFVLDKAKEMSVTLIAIGSLTNVALALKAGFMPEQLIIMGGSFNGRGNRTLVAEANIIDDPLAAQQVVLHGLPKEKIVFIPLDLTQSCPVGQEFLEKLRNVSSEPLLNDVLYKIQSHYYRALGKLGATSFAIHDSIAIIFAVFPELFEEPISFCIDVETCGALTLGMLVVDDQGRWGRSDNVLAVLKPKDAAKVIQEWIDTVTSSSSVL